MRDGGFGETLERMAPGIRPAREDVGGGLEMHTLEHLMMMFAERVAATGIASTSW